MATGHILPGYGQPVSNLRRAKSAGCYPLDNSTLLEMKQASLLAKREFEDIKENARRLWSAKSPRETTYDAFFCDGEIKEITQPRPTSSHRHHNPHPPQVFLTNRLHYIEGYHNPDTRLGKSTYKIDASVSPAERNLRRAPRMKYIARPDSSLVNQFKDPFGFKQHLPPREAQAAEAWVKMADDVDRDRVIDVVKELGEAQALQEQEAAFRPKSAYPSLHRWMRMSGVEESEATTRIMQTLNSNPMRSGNAVNRKYEPCSYEPSNMGHKARQDIATAGRYKFHPRLRRGEFSMHPDWPTSLPHHRVP